MKELNEMNLRDIIEGCTVLGTGGGGDPKEGWKIIKKELNRGSRFIIASLNEISDNGIVPMPYYVGSLSGGKLKSKYDDGEAVRSFKILEKFMDSEFAGVISTELGGANTAAALATAARLNKPIIDGDPAGRSVPELQHTSYHILKVEITPFSVVTPYGDELIVQKVKDDFHGEIIVRSIAASIKTNVGVTSHPISGKVLRHSVIPNAISYAMKIGKALRESRENDKDFINALLSVTQGFLLFRGIAKEVHWEDKHGFTVGEFLLKGVREFDGSTYKIKYKNENIISWRNGKVDVTAPDLISVLTIDGYPVTNPNVKEGKEYVVMGFMAPKIWRTEKGIEIFGPKYLGLDIEYVPIEEKYRGV